MAEAGQGWSRGLLAVAGLLGVAGVGLGAASAHLGGGDLARLAAEFLLFHAAAIPGVLALNGVRRSVTRSAATLMALGAALFSGDVAVLAFTGRSPVSGLAPLGGLCLMGGWLALAVAAFTGEKRTPPA